MLVVVLLSVQPEQKVVLDRYLTAIAVFSQPAWIGLALGFYLLARRIATDGRGSLGASGRAFAGVFAFVSVAVGGYLIWEASTNPGLGNPDTMWMMQRVGWGVVGAGAMSLWYCVWQGLNPRVK